ncbi:hypothetical protein CI610_01894 [invertebrate metagenome]|uniref:Uncharacterized protein n=1 Tax=invertebrate metagenome TaxID=1711999 RepID=A0A2H9T7D2_9ZZZZ
MKGAGEFFHYLSGLGARRLLEVMSVKGLLARRMPEYMPVMDNELYRKNDNKMLSVDFSIESDATPFIQGLRPVVITRQ